MAKIHTMHNTEDNRTLIDLEINKEELMRLRGALNEIIIFSEESLENESRLIKRGKNESTKYFLLPRNLRENISATKNVACSKIETNCSDIFIFSIPKDTMQ